MPDKNILVIEQSAETGANISSAPFTANHTLPVHIEAGKVHETLAKHMLVDGFDIVVDLEKSQGTWIYDARTGKRFLDFFTFFASGPVGLNHPKMLEPAFKERLVHAAINKPSSSDAYTVEMAEFVETFSRVAKENHKTGKIQTHKPRRRYFCSSNTLKLLSPTIIDNSP